MFNDFFLVKLINYFNNRKDFFLIRNKLHLSLFLIDRDMLAQIPGKNYLHNSEKTLDLFYISWDSQRDFFSTSFVGNTESYFPHGYFLLKPNFIRYIDNIKWTHDFIKTTNWLFWFRPNNNFISYFLFCILRYLYSNLIVFPYQTIKSDLRANKLWAKLFIYWVLLFSITAILYKLAIVAILNKIFINLYLNILSWRYISVFVWIVPATIPTIVSWLASLYEFKKEIRGANNVPFFSLKRLNKISNSDIQPTPNNLNNLIKPNFDIDLTSSTDLEDGLVVIGEVSELGFQEITHWVDWTTGLTTVTVFAVSGIAIRAIAGRRWKK